MALKCVSSGRGWGAEKRTWVGIKRLIEMARWSCGSGGLEVEVVLVGIERVDDVFFLD